MTEKRKQVCRLNNRKMRALRRDLNYEVIMTDLYLIGAIPKEVAEKLIGREISPHLTSPIEESDIKDDE